MQRTVYCCDKCRKVIGDKPHFSLAFRDFSGVALPPGFAVTIEERALREAVDEFGKNMPWRVVEKLAGKFLHFCSIKCLSAFFEAALARATKTKP